MPCTGKNILSYAEIFSGENLMNSLFKCVCACATCALVHMNNVSHTKGERLFQDKPWKHKH